MCSTRLKFLREKRVFNNFRFSVGFLDSYELLVYIIDTLSNSNGYGTMLLSKIAPLTVMTDEGLTTKLKQLLSLESFRGRLQRTSGKWGGGGFEISDIPGRGEGGGL